MKKFDPWWIIRVYMLVKTTLLMDNKFKQEIEIILNELNKYSSKDLISMLKLGYVVTPSSMKNLINLKMEKELFYYEKESKRLIILTEMLIYFLLVGRLLSLIAICLLILILIIIYRKIMIN